MTPAEIFLASVLLLLVVFSIWGRLQRGAARRFPPPWLVESVIWLVESVIRCAALREAHEATAVHQAYRRSRSRLAARGARPAIFEWDSYGWCTLARRQRRGRRRIS